MKGKSPGKKRGYWQFKSTENKQLFVVNFLLCMLPCQVISLEHKDFKMWKHLKNAIAPLSSHIVVTGLKYELKLHDVSQTL